MPPVRLMRLVQILPLALVVLLAPLSAAAAQDEVVRAEIQRRAKSGEKDNGYCASIAGGLARLDDKQAQARINQVLSRSDAEGAKLMFATGPAPQCISLEFQPVAMREGKKCRTSALYACTAGGDCNASDDIICEKSPGVWD